MAGYQAQNKKVIRSAFSRFNASADAVFLNGMTKVAKAGLEYLLEAHDNFHPGMAHPSENDTLAAAVAHNGEIVAAFHHESGDDFPGFASSEAKRILQETSGWVVIILSDMESWWYRVDYEIGFLSYSADEIKENFNTFFKPVKV